MTGRQFHSTMQHFLMTGRHTLEWNRSALSTGQCFLMTGRRFLVIKERFLDSNPLLWRRGKWIHAIASFAVFKKVKVGRARRSRHVLARHSHKCAGEIRRAGSAGFVGKDAGVELLRQPAPVLVHAFNLIREMEPLVINFGAQMDPLAGGNYDGRSERIGLRRIRHAGHHAQVFAGRFVVRQVEVMKFYAVVVTHQAGRLLKMPRLKFNDRGGAETM